MRILAIVNSESGIIAEKIGTVVRQAKRTKHEDAKRAKGQEGSSGSGAKLAEFAAVKPADGGSDRQVVGREFDFTLQLIPDH